MYSMLGDSIAELKRQDLKRSGQTLRHNDFAPTSEPPPEVSLGRIKSLSRMALSEDGCSAGLPRVQKWNPLRRRPACGRGASMHRVRSNPSTKRRNRAPGPIDSQDLPSQFRAGPKAQRYPRLGPSLGIGRRLSSAEGAGQERRTQIDTPFQRKSPGGLTL